MTTLFSFFSILLLAVGYHLQSPDGRLDVEVKADGQQLSFLLTQDRDTLLAESGIGLTLDDGSRIEASKVKSARRRKVSETIDAPFYRQSSFTMEGNELDLRFKSGFGVVFRAYNEGVAYRFYSSLSHTYIINNEKAQYAFVDNPTAWLSYSTNKEKPYAMAFQNFYDETTLSGAQQRPAFLPVTVDCRKAKVTLLESDVEAYPGMFVQSKEGSLNAEFAPYPAEMAYYPWRKMSYVKEGSDHIAECSGTRIFPWRILGVARDDREMPVSNLVYALASQNRIGDTSWIQTGKVAWDWWNDWNLTGVPFKSGINMDTYRYYIDFASAHGIEFVVLDEGWYEPAAGDMLTVIPALNLEELIQYAAERNVRLVLWTVFNVLDDQLEAACQKYSAMGIAGFKVDFLDRNDQTAAEMAYRIAGKCAQYHLTLDYHGFYTPTGLNRTFPNIINYESVFGMEEMKWSPKEVDMPRYDVTFPFIRLQSGLVDYTPGAMRNATRSDWNAAYSTPMSQGTRCHQLATYIVYDSPFTMLCDAPTMYQREEEYTRFLCSLPTVFEHTQILQGRLGEYIVTVREGKDGNWYVGGLTNWEARDIDLNFDFLPKDQTFEATLYADGVNAHRQAQDYQCRTFKADATTSRTIHLAPGGGFVLRLDAR